MGQIQEVEIVLPIRNEISPEERERATKSLAESVEVNKALLDGRTAMSNDYNTRINENRGVMQAEAKIVKFGYETKDTVCIMEYDRGGHMVRIRRQEEDDDGEPIWIEEAWRKATQKERTLADAASQEELPGAEGDGTAPEEE